EARLGVKAPEQFVGEAEPLLRCGVLGARQRNFGLHHLLNVETRIDVEQFVEAAEEQARGDEQDHGERHFSRGEDIAGAKMFAAFSGTSATFAKTGLQIGFGREEGGSEAESGTGEKGEKERESKDEIIDADG